nr:autotransporter-associated beta strand repeat-containing protein [Brucella intermedia]
MQFFVDGYKVENGTITLGAPENWINVGDGSLQGVNYVATIASVLDGQNGMIKGGYGTLNLTGQNTYTGNTTVQEGTLELSGNGSINPQSNIILAGTQFDQSHLLINKDGAFTLSNQVSGLGDVTKEGAGTTVFAANNTFSGGLIVEGGTAQAGIADNAFGSGNVTVRGGATLDLNDFNETVGSLMGKTTGDGNIDLGSGTLTLNQNLHGDFSGTISGTGGLTKNGDGDLVLYGENAYAGATTVNRGGLVQGAAGGFSSASAFADQEWRWRSGALWRERLCGCDDRQQGRSGAGRCWRLLVCFRLCGGKRRFDPAWRLRNDDCRPCQWRRCLLRRHGRHGAEHCGRLCRQ